MQNSLPSYSIPLQPHDTKTHLRAYLEPNLYTHYNSHSGVNNSNSVDAHSSNNFNKNTLVYASTSPTVLRAYSFLRPVVQIICEKLSFQPASHKLAQHVAQSDEYVRSLQTLNSSRKQSTPDGVHCLDDLCDLLLNQFDGTKPESQSVRDDTSSSSASPSSRSRDAPYCDNNTNVPNSPEKSTLVTHLFASEQLAPIKIPSQTHLTEEQMLQCLGCYFLAYHAVYPLLDPSHLYRHAKKLWRTMEFGTPTFSCVPGSADSFEERAQIAKIYLLVALGVQECSQSTSFVGICPLDWSICYYNRAIDILVKDSSLYSTKTGASALIDYPPCMSFTQFCTMASVYSATCFDDRISLTFGIMSIQLCDKLKFRHLGEALNEIERKGGTGPDRAPAPGTAAEDVAAIESIRAQYPPDLDLDEAHRTFISALLWVRLINALKSTQVPRSAAQLISSAEVNYRAYRCIAFNDVHALEKRVRLHDSLRNAIEYAASSYMVKDPVSALKRIEVTLQDAGSVPKDAGSSGSAIEGAGSSFGSSSQPGMDMHFNFANGGPEAHQQGRSNIYSGSDNNGFANYQHQPFSNCNLAEKSIRWTRNHFVVFQMFSKLLLYRPFPLTVSIFRSSINLKVNPSIVQCFSQFASELPNLCNQIFTEVLSPCLTHRRLRPSNSEEINVNGTMYDHAITVATLEKDMQARLDRMTDDDDEYGTFGGKLNFFFSCLGAELTLGPFLFSALSDTLEKSSQQKEEKAAPSNKGKTNAGKGKAGFLGKDKRNSKVRKEKEEVGKGSSDSSAVEQFIGCIEFLISEQEQVDKYNMRSAIAVEEAAESGDKWSSGSQLSFERSFIMSLDSFSSDDNEEPINASNAFGAKLHQQHHQRRQQQQLPSAKNVVLIPSPVTELLRTIVQLVQSPMFSQSASAHINSTDKLKIGKCLLARQSDLHKNVICVKNKNEDGGDDDQESNSNTLGQDHKFSHFFSSLSSTAESVKGQGAGSVAFNTSSPTNVISNVEEPINHDSFFKVPENRRKSQDVAQQQNQQIGVSSGSFKEMFGSFEAKMKTHNSVNRDSQNMTNSSVGQGHSATSSFSLSSSSSSSSVSTSIKDLPYQDSLKDLSYKDPYRDSVQDSRRASLMSISNLLDGNDLLAFQKKEVVSFDQNKNHHQQHHHHHQYQFQPSQQPASAYPHQTSLPSFDSGNGMSILNPINSDDKNNDYDDDDDDDNTSRSGAHLPSGLRPDDDDDDYDNDSEVSITENGDNTTGLQKPKGEAGEDIEDENFRIMWQKIVTLFI